MPLWTPASEAVSISQESSSRQEPGNLWTHWRAVTTVSWSWSLHLSPSSLDSSEPMDLNWLRKDFPCRNNPPLQAVTRPMTVLSCPPVSRAADSTLTARWQPGPSRPGQGRTLRSQSSPGQSAAVALPPRLLEEPQSTLSSTCSDLRPGPQSWSGGRTWSTCRPYTSCPRPCQSQEPSMSPPR